MINVIIRIFSLLLLGTGVFFLGIFLLLLFFGDDKSKASVFFLPTVALLISGIQLWAMSMSEKPVAKK